MSTIHTVKEEVVRAPRDILIAHVQVTREQIVSHLEGALRDHVKLRGLVEEYIALLTACDVLGGYCCLELVKR